MYRATDGSASHGRVSDELSSHFFDWIQRTSGKLRVFHRCLDKLGAKFAHPFGGPKPLIDTYSMTDKLPQPSDAPTAADAAVLQLAEEPDSECSERRDPEGEGIAALFVRDKVLQHPAALPGHLHQAAVSHLADVTFDIAAIKNIPLRSE